MYCAESTACSRVGWNYTRCRTWLERKRYCPGCMSSRPLRQVVYPHISPQSKRRKVDTWESTWVTDRKLITAEGEGSPPGYAIRRRILSPMGMGGTRNDQWWGRATTLYQTAARLYGLEQSCISHTEESNSRGTRNETRESPVGPIRARLVPLHECSLFSCKDKWDVPLYDHRHERELTLTRRRWDTA